MPHHFAEPMCAKHLYYQTKNPFTTCFTTSLQVGREQFACNHLAFRRLCLPVYKCAWFMYLVHRNGPGFVGLLTKFGA